MHIYSPHALNIIIQSIMCQTSKTERKSKQERILAQLSLRLKVLAQARGFSRSGELPSLRQGLEEWEQWLPVRSRLGEPSSPERDCISLKTGIVRLSDPSSRKPGRPLLVSPRRDKPSWARLSILATVHTCINHTCIPKTQNIAFYLTITTYTSYKLEANQKQATN